MITLLVFAVLAVTPVAWHHHNYQEIIVKKAMQENERELNRLEAAYEKLGRNQ